MTMPLKKRPLSHEDAESICLDYLAAHDNLERLIHEESRLMRSGQLNQKHILPETKIRLIAAYESACRIIVKHLDELKTLVPKMIEKIILKQKDFEIALNNHQRIISSLHETALDLIRSVADKVGQHEKPKLYAPYGRHTKTNQQTTPVMVNVTY